MYYIINEQWVAQMYMSARNGIEHGMPDRQDRGEGGRAW